MIHKDEATKKGIKIIDSKEVKNALFENLKTHFPQTIKDNQVDLKAIATLLGLETKANIQGYELTFTGKALANALYSTPTQKLLKFEYAFSVGNVESSLRGEAEVKQSPQENSKAEVSCDDFVGCQGGGEGSLVSLNDRADNADSRKSTQETRPTPQNFIIKGDNLDVLKILKAAYSEKIKMIYIDPPYNTKNENFIYPDNFRKDYKAILQEVGLIEIDDEGNEVESETLQFFKNIQSTRTHSGWLSFMLPRLKLARDLLREDGVIFISIDDNEQANLKILCDEIFGEENFVGDFIRKTKSTTNDSKTGVNYQHEFLFCYAKDKEKVNLLGGQKDLSKYKNPDNDPNGAWVSSDPTAKSGDIKTGYFAVKNPYTGKEDYPPEGRFWLFSQNTLQKHINENRIYFKKEHDENERGFIYKRYLKDLKTTLKTFDSLKFSDNKFMNQSATKEFLALGLGEYFTYPKSVEFIKEIINHSVNDNSDYILDFFAGSGTTAHAVMELNAEDNGNRKFILVQIDEPINESKNKVAYDFCKNELKSTNPAISDITIERVKRASAKIANANPNFSVSFSVLALSDKPELITTKQGTLKLLSNANLSPFDKTLNLALQSGKTLDKPLKPIFENRLYQCEDCLYLIACDKEVLEFLRKSQNEYIFIDGFEDLHLEDFLNLDSSLNDRLRVVY